MTQSMPITPGEVRRRVNLRPKPIHLNHFQNTLLLARKYRKDELLRIYRDMIYIREFETLLEQLQQGGSYAGIEHILRGPVHLAIGQEAAAVGQAFYLEPYDQIFGSHRSHAEILAKSLSAIEKLDPDSLLDSLEGYLDGAILRVIERYSVGDEKSLAIDFLLYGMLAEIFGRRTGFNQGLAGSMSAFFPPFGVMPNNGIAGGAAPLATGAALYNRINDRPGIVIANIGDGAMGSGAVWEALVFSGMAQFRTLWENELGGAPPILFNIMNNFYSMGERSLGETLPFDVAARVGFGINAENMHAERVDGYNPLAVADAFQRKRKVLEAGNGPILLETVTYRFASQSPGQGEGYRSQEEIDLWTEEDALVSYADYLQELRVANLDTLTAIQEEAIGRLVHALEAAVSPELSPRFAVSSETVGEKTVGEKTVGEAVGALMFSHRQADTMMTGEPRVLRALDETRVAMTQAKPRWGLDEQGEPLPQGQSVTYAEALFEALLHRFYTDPSLIAYGPTIRNSGDPAGLGQALVEALPPHRCFNSPLSFGAMVGSGVGYALNGGRVVVDLTLGDFLGRAGDEIFNQMAKWQAMSGGELEMPLVLRVPVDHPSGPQQAQDWSSLLAHVPGLQIMFPATPYDAKGMLNLALGGTDPVVFFESRRLYPMSEVLVTEGVPTAYYEVPLGEPVVRRTGNDLTLITIGPMLYRALEAADILAQRYDVSAEVIDTRFLNPLNYEPLVASLAKTGRGVLASDACERGSFLHTMASNLTQLCFDELDSPLAVLGARNWIAPPPELEPMYFPQVEWILDIIHERVLPLNNHVTTTHQSTAEIINRNYLGI